MNINININESGKGRKKTPNRKKPLYTKQELAKLITFLVREVERDWHEYDSQEYGSQKYRIFSNNIYSDTHALITHVRKYLELCGVIF